MRTVKRLLTLVGLVIVLWAGANLYAGWRIRSALIEGGMAAKPATCMARRMVKRLSLFQLRKLEAFQQEKGNIGGFVRAAKRIDDSEVVLVTTTSAALCTTGLAR